MSTTPPGRGPDRAPTATGEEHLDPRRWKALAFICIAQLMVVLDGTVVNIALPHAQADLGLSDTNREWVITAYALAFGGLLLFGGRLADLWGRRVAFIVGLIGFAVASAMGGAAVNSAMLLGSRALQGVFAALLAPAVLSLLTVMFVKPAERAKAFGLYSAISGAGAAVGLILGGVLTEYLDWRWTMYINVLFAVVALIGAVLEIREPMRHNHSTHLDVPGVVLASTGLALVVYGFSHAADSGWTDRWTVMSLIGAAVLLTLFALWQSRTTRPLLPPRVVLDRMRGGAFLSLGLAVVGMFGTFLFLTYYLQVVHAYSPLRSGFAFLPMALGMIVGTTQIGARLVTRFPPRQLMVPGLLVATAGLLWLSRMEVDSNYWIAVAPGLVLMGLGMGTNFMAAMNVATFGVEPRDAGVASAMVNTSQQIGGAIGTALLNTIATSASTRFAEGRLGGIGSAADAEVLRLESMVHGFTVGLTWAAAFLVTAAVVAGVLINLRTPIGRH